MIDLKLAGSVLRRKLLKELFWAMLAFTCFLFPVSVHAVEKGRYSESEKVGFAFYQLANINPDFESWIKNSDRYLNAKPREKVELLQKDIYRLRNGYANFLPDADLISLGLGVKIALPDYNKEQKRKKDNITFELNLGDLPINYFPFQVGDLWIALVVKDHSKINSMTMNPEEYNTIAKYIAMNTYEGTFEGGIDIKLRPLSVDTSAPLMMDGLEMWLMMVEIADMEVWTMYEDQKKYLWGHRASWYTSGQRGEILQLYKH